MNEVIQWLGLVAGGLVSIGVIGLAIRRTIRFIQRAGNAFDSIHALAEEIKPGEFQAFKSEVLHEIRYNSGGSIKDHQDAQTRTLAEQSEALTAIREMLETHITDRYAHGHPDTQVAVNINPTGGN